MRGPTNPARRPRIASTTRSSMRVKPRSPPRMAVQGAREDAVPVLSGTKIIDLENGVEDRKDEPADDEPEKDRADRRHQPEEPRRRDLDLLLQDVAGLDQHLREASGLDTDPRQLDEDGGYGP